VSATAFINTRFQPGVATGAESENRFNGFSRAGETVETVSGSLQRNNTQLKQGVNELQTAATRAARFNPSTF
jgi:hypothetical protein